MQLKSAIRIAGSRCARPEETVARLEAALSAAHPYRYVEERVSDSLYWGALFTEALGFPAMGKGSSPVSCKASTLAEATEWLALARRRALPGHVEATQDRLPDALPIEDLVAHIAGLTPAALQRIKSAGHARHWVVGRSLLSDRAMHVPLEYVHGIGGTNGLAAGNCIEEAIVQGACEVFERRAAITVVKNRMVVPTVDLDTIRNPTLRAQMNFLRAQDVDLTVKDLSFGGALPCIGVYFVNRRLSPELQAHRVLKAAASWNTEAALMNCLTEYAQVCRLGPQRGDGPRDYERLLCAKGAADNFLPLFWFGYIAHANAEFLNEGPLVPFDGGVERADCLDDIEAAREVCRLIGKDFIVVELTDPAVGFPVVQVVVPGYSDILPYHPPSSPVLFSGWTRDLSMGDYLTPDGPRPCTARDLFPAW